MHLSNLQTAVLGSTSYVNLIAATQVIKASAVLQHNVCQIVTENLIMLIAEVVCQLMAHSDVPVEYAQTLWGLVIYIICEGIVPQLISFVESNTAIISIIVKIHCCHARLDELMDPLQQVIQLLC